MVIGLKTVAGAGVGAGNANTLKGDGDWLGDSSTVVEDYEGCWTKAGKAIKAAKTLPGYLIESEIVRLGVGFEWDAEMSHWWHVTFPYCI